MKECDFGKGAIHTPRLIHLRQHNDVAGDSAPFDWNLGYDVTQVIKTDLLTKNQGGAGSCGGEATSYKCEVVYYLNTGVYEPKSARYIYGQCFVPPSGSSDAGLIGVLTTMGTPDTSVFTDSPTTGLPTEAFMENVSDITEAVNENASSCVLGTPIYVNEDMDSMAKAIRDTGGIIIAIYCQNNGTWLSEYPTAPTTTIGAWAHWLYAGKALTINGKQYIGVKNSWSSSVGANGWQYLGIEYLPYIWRAFTFVNLGEKGEFTHTFDTNQTYKFGANNSEVIALQKALKIDGEFPVSQICTGYFGNITQRAVIKFQEKYAKDILTPLGLIHGTGVAGKNTLTKLNSLFKGS